MAIQKDYKAIAYIIKAEYIKCNGYISADDLIKDILTNISMNMANYFASKNKWFNRDTFISECGIE